MPLQLACPNPDCQKKHIALEERTEGMICRTYFCPECAFIFDVHGSLHRPPCSICNTPYEVEAIENGMMGYLLYCPNCHGSTLVRTFL